MKRKLLGVFAGLCVLATAAVWVAPASAQTAEVKEKPPMYSYVSNWAIPRAQWAEMEKADQADQKILEKGVSDGTIVAFGNDRNLIHQVDGSTHDDWWSSMSMAGAMNILDQFYSSGNSSSPVLETATRHWDDLYVSRYYNWRAGTYKNAYTHGSTYKFKADSPPDALDTLSKNVLAPMMEKLLAAGTIFEYEIDTQAIHNEAPGTFYLFYITANADGLDKVNAALRETVKSNPLIGPALDSMVDFTPHRDMLARTNATYK